MKLLKSKNFSDSFVEELDNVRNEATFSLDSPKPTRSAAPVVLRVLGFLVLTAAVLALLFVAPLPQDIPFIASLREPFRLQLSKPGFLQTLSQLPAILWGALLLVGIGLIALSFFRKRASGSVGMPTIFGSGNVENWAAGLKPELAQSALERFDRHLNNCPDAFSAPPGIRLLTINEDRNSRVTGIPQDRIYHWVPDGDQYVIEIKGVINGTMRFVMNSNGKVMGLGKGADGNTQQFSMLPDVPIAVLHRNRNDDTIAKCYITLLGG